MVHAQYSHILNKDCISPDCRQFVEQLLSGVQFIIVDNGVHGNIDFCPELMGITAQLRNIIQRIARSGSRTETGSPYVNRISPMIDGGDATFQVLGRCQQFNLTQYRLCCKALFDIHNN